MADNGAETWSGGQIVDAKLKWQQINEEKTKKEENVEQTIVTGSIMQDISNAIAQIDEHEKDTEFLKRFLHLVIIGYTSHRDEMTKIVKSSPLVNTLLRILKGMGEQEEQLQTIITAILCIVGALNMVREMAIRALNEGHKCGGDFIIFGETQKRMEELILSQTRSNRLVQMEKQILSDEMKLYDEEERSYDEKMQQKEGLVIGAFKDAIQTKDKQTRRDKERNKLIRGDSPYDHEILIDVDYKQKINDSDSFLGSESKKHDHDRSKKKDYQKDNKEDEKERRRKEKEKDKEKKEKEKLKKEKEKMKEKEKEKERYKRDEQRKEEEKIRNKQLEKQQQQQQQQQQQLVSVYQKEQSQLKVNEQLQLQQSKSVPQTSQPPQLVKPDIIEDWKPINFDDLLIQMNQQENEQIPVITDAEIVKEAQLTLKTKVPTRVFENGVFRISCQFTKTLNSRRFGVHPAGTEVFSNIPISNKDFRAITYDEKDGVVRIGWHELFRWNPVAKNNQPRWISFELDLREEIEHNTVRLFIGSEESPIIFIDVPKKLRIYTAYDFQPETTCSLKPFTIPKPAFAKYDI
ncbi:MAG: hypothetical protein EZS28_028023 [Streblomastix strix]|uniref:Uncharacterized protein n=1 Tax=Streblomastix strix TaxID=222440 RepID=A0A5J4V229_9EUKA|nr:MAG: hypothetical protein EZS28_028023 [Streblomastix strix]